MDTATKDMVASIKTSNDVRATIDRSHFNSQFISHLYFPLISQYNNTAFCHFRSEYTGIVEKEQTACKE